MPLGLETGTILDDQITASSAANDTNSSKCLCSRYARLNGNRKWRAEVSDPSKWIQIDLMNNYTVTGIVVQGAYNWVKTCRVKYEEISGSGGLAYVMDMEGNVKVIVKTLARYFTVYFTIACQIGLQEKKVMKTNVRKF